MQGVSWIGLAASVVAAATTAGGVLALHRFGRRIESDGVYFVAFAAGVLVSASFVHIIPEASVLNHQAPAYVVAGFFGLHVLNAFVTTHVCGLEEGSHAHADVPLGAVPLCGIAFHSFLDGVVYSIAFAASTFTGLMASAGMVLHKFPEGMIAYTLLIRSGTSRRRAFWLALGVAACTPLGTVLSSPIIDRVGRPILGALLAASAGTLVYIGATHLLPQAEQQPRRYSLLALVAGVLVVVGIELSEV